MPGYSHQLHGGRDAPRGRSLTFAKNLISNSENEDEKRSQKVSV